MNAPHLRWASVVGLALGLLGAGVGCKPPPAKPDAPDGDGQACTEEAKICPDGSAVGRTGPHCEFAPCPGGDPDALSPDPAPAGPDGSIAPQPMGTFQQPDNPPG